MARPRRPARHQPVHGEWATTPRSPTAKVGIPGPKSPEGYTWHRVEDGKTMELVPEDLHNDGVMHTGGRAAMSGQRREVTPGGALRWGERGTGAFGGLGGGPAAGGAGPVRIKMCGTIGRRCPGEALAAAEARLAELATTSGLATRRSGRPGRRARRGATADEAVRATSRAHLREKYGELAGVAGAPGGSTVGNLAAHLSLYPALRPAVQAELRHYRAQIAAAVAAGTLSRAVRKGLTDEAIARLKGLSGVP